MVKENPIYLISTFTLFQDFMKAYPSNDGVHVLLYGNLTDRGSFKCL